MFISVDDRPLIADQISPLSAGAVKLLMIIRAEPNASQKRYVDLVGMCERSVRNFGRELLDSGFVCRATTREGAGEYTSPVSTSRVQRQKTARSTAPAVDAGLDDLSVSQRDCYELLISKGVEARSAHNLAQQYDKPMVVAAIDYIQHHQPAKPAGYLVWCLKNPQFWYQPVMERPVPGNSAKSIEFVEPVSSMAVAQLEPVANDPDMVSGPLVLSSVIAINDTGITMAVGLPQTFDTLLLAYAVEATTGVDVRINEEALQTVEQLQQAHYTAENVAMFAEDVFPRHDWRGQKGEKPTLQALREGIAAVRHQLHTAQSKQEGVLYRVQAIRRYSPLEIGPMGSLSDLWSKQVQAAVAAESRAANYCPTCNLPWSMCRCEETPLCLDPAAQWWTAMIGQLKVQLNKATFETWLASLRLIGFEPDETGDSFIVECVHEYQRDWLTTNVLVSMVEALSRLHYPSANIVEGVVIQAHIELVLPDEWLKRNL